jgi:hypothetical protein
MAEQCGWLGTSVEQQLQGPHAVRCMFLSQADDVVV